jgi:hypothetical protein
LVRTMSAVGNGLFEARSSPVTNMSRDLVAEVVSSILQAALHLHLGVGGSPDFVEL